ncbi:hypothetical protein MW887_001694 [Aspergillus wentii]|nr:hypothetical protein MW887_001694 [Aspergillus wentii]
MSTFTRRTVTHSRTPPPTRINVQQQIALLGSTAEHRGDEQETDPYTHHFLDTYSTKLTKTKEQEPGGSAARLTQPQTPDLGSRRAARPSPWHGGTSSPVSLQTPCSDRPEVDETFSQTRQRMHTFDSVGAGRGPLLLPMPRK